MSKKGLPAGIRMRHDAHYVEELASQQPTPIGRLISIDNLDPNPNQPRVEVGDLSELVASISDKGVLEPLLVKPNIHNGRWMIIAGERRWRAAKTVGLKEVPCIEMNIDERSVAEIALIENLQRKDLTPWEEADGLAALCDRFGYTHDDVAKKIGKSRTSVTESMSIASLPEKIRERCQRANIHSKSLLLQIARQPDQQTMEQITEEIEGKGITRDEARKFRRVTQQQGRANRHAQPFVFKFSSSDTKFQLELKFKKNQVEKEEIIEALKLVVEKLGEGVDSI